MTPQTLAWAIKAPDGVLIVKSNNDTEEKAWGCFKSKAEPMGYRCVRVEIREVE